MSEGAIAALAKITVFFAKKRPMHNIGQNKQVHRKHTTALMQSLLT